MEARPAQQAHRQAHGLVRRLPGPWLCLLPGATPGRAGSSGVESAPQRHSGSELVAAAHEAAGLVHERGRVLCAQRGKERGALAVPRGVAEVGPHGLAERGRRRRRPPPRRPRRRGARVEPSGEREELALRVHAGGRQRRPGAEAGRRGPAAQRAARAEAGDLERAQHGAEARLGPQLGRAAHGRAVRGDGELRDRAGRPHAQPHVGAGEGGVEAELRLLHGPLARRHAEPRERLDRVAELAEVRAAALDRHVEAAEQVVEALAVRAAREADALPRLHHLAQVGRAEGRVLAPPAAAAAAAAAPRDDLRARAQRAGPRRLRALLW